MYINKRRTYQIISILLLSCILCIPGNMPGPVAMGDENNDLGQDSQTAEDNQYYTVKEDTFTKVFTSNYGKVTYTNNQDIYNIGASGVITQMLIAEGGEVKKGDPLLAIQEDYSEAQAAEYRIGLENLKQNDKDARTQKLADIKALENQVKASEDGYDRKMLSLDLKKAKLDYDNYQSQADAQILQAQQAYDDYTAKKKERVITAPITGITQKVIVKKAGETLEENALICNITDTSKVLIDVEDSDHALKYDMPVTVTDKRNGEENSYPGHVVSDASADHAFIMLDDASKKEFKDITITAVIEKVEQAVIIDPSLIYEEDGASFVYLYDGNIIEKQYIVIGDKTRDQAWIIQGLSPKQSILMK